MSTTSYDSYFTGLRARLRTRITAVVATFAMVASGGALVVAAPQAGASPTLALLDGVQLDGNTTVEAATPGAPTAWGATSDWNSILGACTNQAGIPFSGSNVAGTSAGQQPKCPSDTVWVKDFYTTSGADDAFTLGSKDILDPNDASGTPGWNWVNFQTPDKNDLTDVFATVKEDNLYVGANRYATNGDAYIGFWLFKSSVASKCTTSTGVRIFVDSRVGATGTPVSCVADAGNPGGVIGTFPRLRHKTGDILILINYTNGGAKTDAKVYAWNPAAPNNLEDRTIVTGTTGDDCVASTPSSASIPQCSTTNTATKALPAAWGYVPKSGSANNVSAGGFFEAGVDLTRVLPTRDTCFSSIIGETRSSDSPTAETKDFAGGAFQPCHITVTKSGPAIGKVGDDPADLLNYTVTVTNDGDALLYRKSIVDSIAGDLLGTPNAGISNVVNNCGASLAVGASCTITYSYKAKISDPDPLLNTVTVTYNATSDLTGSDVSAADDHTVNLFQPAVGIDKTCDALSKIGDPYTCSVTVTNTGSSDSPASIFDSLTDSKAGNLLGTPNAGTTITANTCKASGTPVALLPGASCTVTYDRITLVSDSDPIINTATVHMHPTGFPNDLSASDSASINLFQPGINVVKTCDALSKATDPLNCSVTVTNTSSNDSPNLVLDSVTDTIVGNLNGTLSRGTKGVCPVFPVAGLAPGASWTCAYSFVVLVSDPDPLVNTVTVHTHPAGFPNDIWDDDTATTNLFQPSIGVAKSCDDLSKIGDDAFCTVTVTNSGSSDSPNLLLDTVNDTVVGNLNGTLSRGSKVTCPAFPVAGLAVGATWSCTYKFTVVVSDPDPIVNTVTVHTHPAGFPNDIYGSDSDSINLFQPSLSVDKTCDALSKATDPAGCSVVVTNTGSSDSPALGFDQDPAKGLTDTVVGDLLGANGALTRGTKLATSTCFRATTLAVGASCRVDYVFTVTIADPDPIVNTASAWMHPAGFPNDIKGSDSASINLFQPSLSIDKTCDALSKIGDPVDCSVVVTNTSSNDAPNLKLDSILDTMVGNLNGTLSRGSKVTCPAFPVAGLAPAGSWTCSYRFTVLVSDPDPIVNTVIVHTHPDGFPNDIYGSDSASINLFQPSVRVDKTCDALSKATDPLNCTVTVTNTGSSDSPNLTFDQDPTKGLTDTVVGDLLGANGALTRGTKLATSTCFRATSLAVGASCKVDYVFTVTIADPDPLVNTASAWMHPVGFPNDIKGSDSASTNLFQPGISVDKTCDALSKIGDPVDCSVVVTNTSSNDAPNLKLDSVVDSVVGNLNGTLSRGSKVTCPAFPVAGLASAASWTCSYRFTVLGTDPDPLVNTVTVHTHPDGFPNDIYGSDSASINLFQPSVRVDKTCDPLSKATDPVDCTVTVTNTGSSDSPNLVFDADANRRLKDSLVGDLLGTLTRGAVTSSTCTTGSSLPVGGSCTVSYRFTVLISDPDPLVNTVSVWMHPVGFPNDIKDTDSASINLFQPSLSVDKTCDALSKVTDPVDCSVVVTNTSSNDAPNLKLDSVVDSVVGNLNGTLSRGSKVTCPAFPVAGLAPAGSWTCSYRFTVLVSDPDPLVNTVTVHTHPDGFPNDIYGSDSASINLFQPSLSVDKVGSITAGVVGDTVTYTVTVTNTGSSDSPNLVFDADPTKGLVDTKAGDLLRTLNAGYTLVSRTCLPATSLTVSPAAGSSCEVVFSHVLAAADTNPLVNVASAWMHPVGFPNDIKGSDDWSVAIKNPDFTITKQCVGGNVPIGGTAIFDITVTNTGDVPLVITVTDSAASAAKLSGSPISIAAGYALPSLAPGASVVITDVAEVVTVANITPDGYVINHVVGTTTYGSKTITKEADARCKIDQGATRTPGFWQTHVSYTTHIFRDALGSRIDLGWRVLTTKEQVFGMFWASNSRNSDGTRRTSVCQARVIGSFQLLAAILNTGLSNGAAVPVDTVTGNSIIVAMRAALAAGNVTEIKRLQGLLDAYNNSGDAVAIVDNWGVLPGNASPTTAKSISDFRIADC